ncbi:hypothetical protein FBEOM_6689 [Fusarium beomiforme]|uniref:Uncharacterized protein n=1 Tax=Fusarium beomiforme TaxID=44412 RepID=A0A9P5DYE5_9HYPO|nr:hypothetical protein FBEOM_6689 [Fusarium beomiforme]
MSDGSASDSDAELIDLTRDDNSHPGINGHENPAPEQEEISLGVDYHGEQILHVIYRPPDPMDVDDGQSSSDDGQNSPESEGSLFIDKDRDCHGDCDDNDDSDDEPSDSGPSDSEGDDDVVERQRQPNTPHSPNRQSAQAADGGTPGGGGGDPGGNDPDNGDGDDNSDSDDDSENDGNHDGNNNDDERYIHINPDAGIEEALEEDNIGVPDWHGTCFQTCQPYYEELALGYIGWRRLFARKLHECRRLRGRYMTRVGHLNQLVGALKEAVGEFYAANEANIQENIRLHQENEALRNLLPEAELDDFPESVPLNIDDMQAALPENIHNLLPEGVTQYLRIWRRGSAVARKTEREWPKAHLRWIRHGWHPNYESWGDIYKLACREENMSWAFSKNTRPKTHPHLTLRPPTHEEEASAITGDCESSTPRPDGRVPGPRDEEDLGPFLVDVLPDGDRVKIIIKILRYALVFDGKFIHAISRLDPYFEPVSANRNCNNQISLLHRFHIGREPVSLTFGTIHPQRLLAPLLVCKEWNMIGSSMFYGANTFAFSSIGE